MSEYVLAALVKCPLTPSVPVATHRQQWFHSYRPTLSGQEAKTSAYE